MNRSLFRPLAWLLLGLAAFAVPLRAQQKPDTTTTTVVKNDSVQKTAPIWVPTTTITTLIKIVVHDTVPTKPPVAVLTVSPKTVSAVISGNFVQFTATGASSVTWTATGGPVSATGLYWPGKTAGTYRVIASSGKLADTATVTITGAVTPPPVDTTKLPPSTGTGNLFNVTFEDGSFGGMTQVTHASIATSGCYSGSKCLDFNLTGNDGSAYVDLGSGRPDVYVSFAVKVITPPTGGPHTPNVFTQKMVIFRNTGNAPNQFGEMNQIQGNWIWSWLFSLTNSPNYDIGALGSPSAAGWHTFKMHLHCASPATITWGKDGVESVATLTNPGGPCAGPVTQMTFGGPNNDLGPSHFQFDNIHIGTVDPGWP
ncbi:MAG TPA: hypothetical protein VK681_39305 [Reyranella sp.]|nr:hypothetical protein [Reyranella sp.]